MTSSLLSASKSATAVNTGRSPAPVLTVCWFQEVSSPAGIVVVVPVMVDRQVDPIKVPKAMTETIDMKTSRRVTHFSFLCTRHLIYTRPVGYSCLEISMEPEMIDIQIIRDEPERVRKAIADKRINCDLDRLIAVDNRRRALQQE